MFNCFQCGAGIGPSDRSCRECDFPAGLSANMEAWDREIHCAFAPVWEEPALPATVLLGFIFALAALSFLTRIL